jgi:nucleoside-diphosphate-sugar epimerase
MDTLQPRTSPRILVTGALGQIGSELIIALRARYGTDQVLASDIREPAQSSGPFHQLDVTNREAMLALVEREGITQIYHLAAILSAKGEQNPTLAWDINMGSLLNVLEVARHSGVERIFWPSSIAVFGPGTPKDGTPQQTITDPTTVYGISKLAGEGWCAYYRAKFGIDVRSIRYPGLIGYQGLPGGGTTDYAVEIFHAALRDGQYTCSLEADTALPMMFMPDAIRATLELMEASQEKIQVRDAYNLQGITFTPAELAAAISEEIHAFSCRYEPDFRQQIANNWPARLDDQAAREDWNWKPDYDLAAMTQEMLREVRSRFFDPIKA